MTFRQQQRVIAGVFHQATAGLHQSLLQARQRPAPKLGFHPPPITEADRIRRFLRYPEKPRAAIDACLGDGVAFAAITREARLLRNGR